MKNRQKEKGKEEGKKRGEKRKSALHSKRRRFHVNSSVYFVAALAMLTE